MYKVKNCKNKRVFFLLSISLSSQLKSIRQNKTLTLSSGSTWNAPPPATSVTIAKNFGLTAQNWES